MADLSLGLSFDDVLLVPKKSAILPTEAKLGTSLCDGIPLHIPVVSAAMDTVSETDLAVALAREGGIGVIHRACSIEDQAAMVTRVKRSESAVIHQPFTARKTQTLTEIREIMLAEGFSGFPVVDSNGVLEGMVTGRDVRYHRGDHATVADVMTPQDRLVTAPPTTSQEEARKLLYDHRIEKLPLVDAEGRLAGLITGADIEKHMKFTNAAKDPNGQLRCGAAVGVGPEWRDRGQALVEAGADALFIDAATGHLMRVLDVVSELRSLTGLPVVPVILNPRAEATQHEQPTHINTHVPFRRPPHTRRPPAGGRRGRCVRCPRADGP